MKKKSYIFVLLILSLTFLFFTLSNPTSSAHRDDPSLAKLLGLQPPPAQKIPQPASLLVSVVDSNTGAFLDANVALYRVNDFDREKNKGELQSELIQIKGTRGKHVFFDKIILGKNEKKDYEQEFFVEINALDYEVEKRFVTLREGEYQEIRVRLEKKRKRDLCKDSDDGIDPLKAGITTYNPVPKLPERLQKQEDRCKENNLIEYYCSDKDTMESVELKCPGVCKEGRCVAEPYCSGNVCAPVEKMECYSSVWSEDLNPFLQSKLNFFELVSEPRKNLEERVPENKAPPVVIPPKKIHGKIVDDNNLDVLLEIGVFGEGEGMVGTREGVIISCDSKNSPCQGRYPLGKEVIIVVQTFSGPNGGSKVGSFEQCKPISENECVVVMDGPKKVSVRFDPTLNVEIKSSCLDVTHVKHFICSPLVSLPENLNLQWQKKIDIPRIPKEISFLCPSGYSCLTGRCVQKTQSVSSSAGDANKDGAVTIADVEYMKNLLASNPISYEAAADFDSDGTLTQYDLYRTEHLVAGDIPRDVKLPIRELSLNMGNQFLAGANNALGELKEGSKIWRVEVSQKGSSRNSCRPIVMNIEFPRKDQFPGMTTYANLGTLKYKKLRFIPDCDILKTHEVNNLLREYIIYSLFREEEVPTVDVAGFAKIGLVSPDKDIDHSIAHEYMILQRDREEKDQISFLQQFGFSAVIENVPEPFNYWDYDRSNVFSKLVLQNFKNDDNSFYEKKILRAEKEIFLDPVTGSRYWILTQLVDLEDRGLFHNDDLGIDAKTGLWKNIPFDMDSSFECYLYNSDPEEIVKGFDSAKKSSYYSTLHRSARELFDDPDVLNRMLLLVDKFPFVDNKDKMKRTLELRFYYYALYFGSEEFSKKIGQTHVPYKNYDNYQKEAKRIINMKTFETMCHGRDFRDVLEQFVQPIKKNPDSIPPAPPQIPVPKI